MRGLANPVIVRAAVVLFCSTFAFLLGLVFMRMLRKSIREEADVSGTSRTLGTMPMHLYNTVIQQLKQQKIELVAQSQAEQQRTRTMETFSQAVIANLPSGVLVFATNGLVKTSNPAAKQILGFASVAGMALDDVFRGALIRGAEQNPQPEDVRGLSEEIETALREGGPRREVKAEYETPNGESRTLSVVIVPVTGPEYKTIGAACLIDWTKGSRVGDGTASSTALRAGEAAVLHDSIVE